MKKISIKIAGIFCITFSLLMRADTNQDSISQKEQLSKIMVINGTGACNYGCCCPEFSQGHLFNTINFMTIDLPINTTTLKTELEKISQYSDSSRDVAVGLHRYLGSKTYNHEASFFFLKSILNRNDTNANFIQNYLGSKDQTDMFKFAKILRSEQEAFIQNNLNQDYALVSLLKQAYHALAGAAIMTSSFQFCESAVVALIFYYPIILGFVSWLRNRISLSSSASLALMTYFSALVIGQIGRINPPHWYQFDILNMLSKSWTVTKYGMATATMALLTWFFYDFTKFAINQYRLDKVNGYLNERYAPYHLNGLKDIIQGYVGGDLT